MSAPAYDVILNLGGGITPDGKLPEDIQDRVRFVSAMYEKGQSKHIITSGSVGYKEDFEPRTTEAEAMKQHLQVLGVPEEAILTETDSKDTVGNIYFTKVNFLIPHNWKSVLVVPAPNHSFLRLEYILQKVFGPDYEYELAQTVQNEQPTNMQRESESLQILQEALKNVVDGDHEAIYKLMVTKHPGYMPNKS